MERHFFVGGNTCNGFVNLYNGIIDKSQCKRFYIIKGGSGVGKSTMIRTVSQYFKESGYDIEYFHCSGDIDSLDGMKIPMLGVAMIDGTSPHMVDPIYVKVTDFVVELSQFVDEKKLTVTQKQLAEAMNNKALCYKNAYKLIEGIGTVYKNINEIYNMHIDAKASEKLTKAINKSINIAEAALQNRSLFSGAITAEGEYYMPNKVDKKIIRLTGNKFLGSSVIKCIAELLQKNEVGYDSFCSPIDTKILYELEVGNTLVTVLENTETTGKVITYNVDSLAKINGIEELTIAESKKIIAATIPSISKLLQQAKLIHMDIEKFYAGSVDFGAINAVTEGIIKDIKCLNKI